MWALAHRGYGVWWGVEPWAWFLLGALAVLLVLGLALLLKGLGGRREDRALEILRERYARGEIDQETYERMKRDLR